MDIFTTVFIVTAFIITVYAFYANEQAHKKNLRELEIRFLLGSAHFISYKYQMLEMLKIIYEKAAETDEQYARDYEKIVETFNAKYSKICDDWIKELNKSLGYETEYKNWEEATKYIDTLMKKIRDESS